MRRFPEIPNIATPAFTAFACLLPLLLASCAAPKPPSARPGSGGSRVYVDQQRQQQSRQRWRAVPAKADGAVVPGGRRHIVKRGETGIAIAIAYGVSWSRIAAANRIERDSILLTGQALFIPTGSSASQQASGAQNRNTQTRASQTRDTQARDTQARSTRRDTAARPARPLTPEEQAAAFRIDVDDLITGSAEARDPQPRAAAGQAAAPAPRPPVQATMTAAPRLAWPVDGRVILSRFGPKPGGRVNDGVNIKAVRGSPVRAAADGEVIYVGDAIAGFGLLLLLRHENGFVTAYGHLEDALADRGDRVQRGQPIGRAGSSGEAREPQLLFQLRQGRRALDPLPYLPR